LAGSDDSWAHRNRGVAYALPSTILHMTSFRNIETRDQTASRPARPVLTRTQERWILGATIVASTMAFSDMTIVNVALPVLQRTLKASFAEVQWVVESYTLVLSALILVGGAIGDLYGRRRVFSIGIVIFALASAGCGLSASPAMLVVSRGIQGLGAALMMPGSLAIVSASFPRDRQGHVIGIWSSVTGISMAIAPAFGGWLIDTFSWHAVFLINLPLAAVALAITWRKVPESRSTRSRSLDFKGMACAIIGLGSLTYGLIEAGGHGFADPRTFGPMGVGAIALMLFILAEKTAAAPMIPLSFFRIPSFSAIQAFTFLLWAALQGTTFFVPFRLMQVQGFAPTQAGFALLPLVVTAAILSRWFGRLTDRVPPRFLLISGACFTGVGFFTLMFPDTDTSYFISFMPSLFLMGIGMGICQVPVTVVALNAAGPSNVGTASAVNNMAARTGGLIAIAVFGLVLAQGYNNALTQGLREIDLPEAARHALDLQRSKLAGAVIPAGLPEDQRAAVAVVIKQSFVTGYRWAMFVAGMMAFLSVGIAIKYLARADRKSSSDG
jgi:EmrB/QacA subfamily drug resistance transporter